MSDPQNVLSVTHIQYLKWMEDSVPTITSPILEIANLVQSILGSGNKPIVVMCNIHGTIIDVHQGHYYRKP